MIRVEEAKCSEAKHSHAEDHSAVISAVGWRLKIGIGIDRQFIGRRDSFSCLKLKGVKLASLACVKSL